MAEGTRSRFWDIFDTRLGRIIVGILKLALASFLVPLVNILKDMTFDIQIGNNAVLPLGLIVQILVAFFPLLLLISALRDLGINI